MRRRHCSLPPQDDRGSLVPRSGYYMQPVGPVSVRCKSSRRSHLGELISGGVRVLGRLAVRLGGRVGIGAQSQKRTRRTRRTQRTRKRQLPKKGAVDQRWTRGERQWTTHGDMVRRFQEKAIRCLHYRPFRVLRVLRVFCVRFLGSRRCMSCQSVTMRRIHGAQTPNTFWPCLPRTACASTDAQRVDDDH